MKIDNFHISILLLFIGIICEPIIRESNFMSVVIWGAFLGLNMDIWKVTQRKCFFKLNILLLTLALIILISCYAAQNVIKEYLGAGGEGTTMARAFFKAIGLVSSILFVEKVIIYRKSISFLKVFLSYLIIYIFLIDIDALLFVSNNDINKRDYDLLYIAGNKFDLTYTNMYLLFVYGKYNMMRNRFKKKYYYCLLGLCFFMSLYSRCSTSIIACAFLICFFILKLEEKKIIYKPTFYIFVATICTFALLLFSAVILSTDVVKSVLGILGESEDLTSRLIIWERISVLFDQRPLLGFGVGNVGGIVSNLSNAFDTQNGVLDLYLQVGLIGVVSYFSLLLFFLQSSKYDKSSAPFVAYMYMLLIISMVEIPLTFPALFLASFTLITDNNNLKCKNRQDEEIIIY